MAATLLTLEQVAEYLNATSNLQGGGINGGFTEGWLILG